MKEVKFMNLSRNDSRMLAMIILYQIDLYTKKKIDYSRQWTCFQQL